MVDVDYVDVFANPMKVERSYVKKNGVWNVESQNVTVTVSTDTTKS